MTHLRISFDNLDEVEHFGASGRIILKWAFEKEAF